MSISWYAPLLRFAPVPVSLLLLLLYGSVFGSVFVNDRTPEVPGAQGDLNLTTAFKDLHYVTQRPHPFNAHSNDQVHQYLLSRVESITKAREYMHISNDLFTNASYVSGQLGTYFEGQNILVKVDGTDPDPSEPDGVLFAAHYDSVHTAPGATDNAMSVVALLNMVELLSIPENRPRRTAVFFFNNGEEEGLNGSHMFFEHPWSQLTSTFMNVEGAGAGGRPLLFRGTTVAPVRAFTSSALVHPHANVLSADAFARGLVKSRTDYQVFLKGIPGQNAGMEGLDLAFYKNRAVYHTPLDSIPGMGTGEARKALWAMMENVRGVGLSLLNDDKPDDGQDTGVYFDVLGRLIIVFRLRNLFISNVILLVLGPIVTLVMLAWVVTIKKEHSSVVEEGIWAQVKKVLLVAAGWGRFWVVLLICIGSQVGLVIGYIKLNPFVIHSHPYAVLTTSLALSYLGYTLPLSLFEALFPSSPSSQKLAILLQSYFLTWVLLVLSTIAIDKYSVGGLYWVTAWYIATLVGSLVSLAEAASRAQKGSKKDFKNGPDLVGEQGDNEVQPGERRLVRGVLYQAPEHVEDEENAEEAVEPVETEPTEITPLMAQHRRLSSGGREYVVGVDDELAPAMDRGGTDVGSEEAGWWALQMLVVIPLPALLLSQLQLLLLQSLGGTLVDGSSPIIAYGGVALFSVLIFVHIAPFAHLVHRNLTLAILIVFALSLTYTWTTFPFTREAPLKVWFAQTVELDLTSSVSGNPSGVSSGSVIRAVTQVSGPQVYLDKYIVPELPSSWDQEVICHSAGPRPGLMTCNWTSSLLPSPGGIGSGPVSPYESPSRWLDVETVRLGSSSALVSVQGTNTRNCRLKFDKPITSFHIYTLVNESDSNPLGPHYPSGRIQPGYEITEKGVEDLILFSREWDHKFVVEFSWNKTTDSEEAESFGGRVGCEWSEYASASAGSSYAATSAEVPAMEELLHFLPLWATVTKLTYGVVEVEGRFSI